MFAGADTHDMQAPAQVSQPVSQQGVVEVWYWEDVDGFSASDLVNSSAFTEEPDSIERISQLSNRRDRGDRYGAWVRGFIEPQAAGQYRFFISSDDQSEFYLSTSSQAEGKVLIAAVPGWTLPGVYTKYSPQKSAIQYLQAGRRYYFEIILKENQGGDHFMVAWEGPGFARSIVPSGVLSSWAPPSEAGEEGIDALDAYNLGYRVGFLDGKEELAFNPEYPPLDEDQDGMYDNWEVVYGLDPTDPSDASTDPDGDLLSAAEEFFLGTEEGNPDTDADGIQDGDEFAMGLNPLDPSDAEADTGSVEPDTDGNIVELNWTAPASREDGKSISLGEIKSYTVRFGRDEAELNHQVEVGSAGTSYQIDGFESGLWYFAVQVVDTNNRVSKLSKVLSHSIP